MQVDIIGGGAVGLLYGARLAEAGAGVTIWTRTASQAERLREQGITWLPMGGGKARIAAVNSVWIEDKNGMQGERRRRANEESSKRWILLTVKQTAINEELLLKVNYLAGSDGASIMCMQNGVGHMKKVRGALPESDLYAAVISEGALRHDDCTVEHTGAGELWFGHVGEKESIRDKYNEISLKMFISCMQSAGIAIFLSKEMDNRIYNKLLINAVINPLTALFQLRNGELPADPLRLKLMKAVYDESVQVLAAAGLKPPEASFDRVLEVCRLTSGNRSSMLSDVQAGRKTEIAYINGGIASIARERGRIAPLNEAMTALIESLNHTSDKEK